MGIVEKYNPETSLHYHHQPGKGAATREVVPSMCVQGVFVCTFCRYGVLC